MKGDKKKEHREENLKNEDRKNREKLEQKQREKDSKQIKKVGKALMTRVYAPPVQKVKEKVKERTKLEEAYFKYL